MGGTSRVATCHDKDVLGVEVKRDIPQDMGLHLVARRASIDKDRPQCTTKADDQKSRHNMLDDNAAVAATGCGHRQKDVAGLDSRDLLLPSSAQSVYGSEMWRVAFRRCAAFPNATREHKKTEGRRCGR
jgi:hypothetical protein